MSDQSTLLDAPMEVEQVNRARELFGAGMVSAIQVVGKILANDPDMPPDEMRTGMFFAHIDTLASAIESCSADQAEQDRLVEIAAEQLRRLLSDVETADVR